MRTCLNTSPEVERLNEQRFCSNGAVNEMIPTDLFINETKNECYH